MKIRRVSLAEIAAHRRDAEKAGISFSPNAHLYLAEEDGKPAGFTAVLWQGRRAIFKNSYVIPEFRRKGIYRKLFNFRVRLARLYGCDEIEAHCTSMSLPIFVEHGAEVLREFKSHTKVRVPLATALAKIRK